jgi:hypothetical protein
MGARELRRAGGMLAGTGTLGAVLLGDEPG